MTPWTPNTLPRSLYSLSASIFNWIFKFLQSCGAESPLYGILTLFTFLLVFPCMVYSVLQRFIGRRSEQGSPREPTVGSEVPGQGENFSENAVHGARRRKHRPPKLNLTQSAPRWRTSSSSDAQSPKPTTLPRTFTSGNRFDIPPEIPLSSPPPDIGLFSATFLGTPRLVESPTTERDPTPRQAGMKPISPLPTEILVMIFQCVLPRQGIYPDRTWPMLLPLRQVCRKWKTIIENTPKLWPSLYPPLKGTKDDAGVDWYISLTGGLSKQVAAFEQVVLALPEGGQDIHRNLFQHLLSLAIQSVSMKVHFPSRFRLDATVLNSPLLGFSTRRRPSEGPVMEHLRRVEWVMESHYFQEQLPSDLELPWSSLRQLPWAQLTHVSLGLCCMTLQDCEFILDHAVMVEDVALRLVSGDPLPISEPEPEKQTLSYLHSLKIHTAASISSLLRRYDLPRLRHLDLDLGGRETSTDLVQPVIPWPQLTHVTLNCFLEALRVENVVRQLDSIHALTLKGQLLDVDTWTIEHILGSLKSFVLIPMNDAAALPIISHFIQRVFPTTIELIDAPLDPLTFRQMLTSSRPFSSIRTAKLAGHPILPDDFLSFLTLSTNLIEGSFLIRDFDEPYSPSSPSAAFPSLSPPASPFPIPTHAKTRCKMAMLNLHLDFQSISAKPLLDALVLPSLSSLTFRASRNASDCDGLYQLLRRSGCLLSSLVLDCPKASDAGVLKILGLLTSTLEVFEIRSNIVTSAFGESLCQGLMHGGTNCLCPRLERLCIRPCIDALSFYDMVRSRSNFPNDCDCRLRKLRHVDAGLVSDQAHCSEFAQWLKERRITSNLDLISHSAYRIDL